MKPDLTQLQQLFGRLGGHSSLHLVAVHTGYRLWLGLLQRQPEPALLAVAQSNALDAVAAVAETHQQVLQQAQAQGISRLPRQITLVSAAALSALLDLPVEPAKPRKADEMESMIGWELENQVADNNESYSLGAILSGRGLVSLAQRAGAAAELETRRLAGNSLARFGEVAVEMGLIDNQQLQDCLHLQEKLVISDARLACGWQLQTLASEDDTQYQWLVAGMDTRVRRQWFHAFAQQGLRLQSILPLAGSAAPWVRQLSQFSQHGNLLIVEACQDNLLVCRLQQGQFASLQLQPRQWNKPLAGQCQALLQDMLRSDTESIILLDATRQPAAAKPDTELNAELGEYPHHLPDSPEINSPEINRSPDSCAELSQLLQRPVHWLFEPAPQATPDRVLAAFYSALLQPAPGTTATTSLPQVPPREPPPPLWKNRELYRYGTPALLLLALLGHGSYSLWQRATLDREYQQLDAEYKRKLDLNKQLTSISGTQQRLENELASLEEQAKTLEQELRQLNDGVISRTRLVPRLVKTLALSVTNQVVLDSILEPAHDSKNRFNINAWATDNPAASEFVERLQQMAGRLGYRVTDADIRAGIGRYGLNGYNIQLWLVPDSSAPHTFTAKGKSQ